MQPTVVALDLETTGLNPYEDRIVEFCLMRLDDELNVIETWTERVNPGMPIPAETTEIHGISDEDVADKPGFEAFAPKVQEWIQGTPLMAYNHTFDLTAIHEELARAGQTGITLDHPTIDPYHIFRTHVPHSLTGAVRYYLDETMENAHEAEADVLAMVRVYKAQMAAYEDLENEASKNLIKLEKRFLDRQRKFYIDEEGIVRFNFGRDFRDQPALERPDILSWMLNKDFGADAKRIASRYLEQARKLHREAVDAERAANS